MTYAYSLTQASFGFAEILGPSVGGLMFQVGVDQAENFTRHLRIFYIMFLYINIYAAFANFFYIVLYM